MNQNESQGAEDRLDAMMCAAFDTNHPAMHDYVLLKMELKRSRAALKAQPAPTEAQGEAVYQVFDTTCNAWEDIPKAQYDRCNPSYRRILYTSAQPSGNTGELVQGEDSARLADGYISGTVISDPHATWVALRYESMEKAEVASDLIFGIIDKENGFSCAAPQPQEQS